MKNITNLNSIGVGLYPAVANLNMAGNSIVSLNQINGQKFPASAGICGQTLHVGQLGVMYWDYESVGPSGPVGPTGPAQLVGGLCGQITFNWDLTGDGIGESVGDAGLTYDWCAQIVNAYTLNLTKNLSVGSNVTVSGFIVTGAATCNSIGNVVFNNGSIVTSNNTSNTIGGWVLNSNSFYTPSMSITTSGSITTPATISSSIAGVYMINSTISAANSVIGGITLSAGSLTASGLTINGTTNITSATTISGLLTVSAAQVQTYLNVSGLATTSNLTVLNSLSANSIYSTTAIGAGGALNISGLATLSAAQIQGYINVSGLATMSNLTVQGSLSAASVYSTTTIGAGGALSISGLATLSGAQIQNTLSISGALYGTTASLSAIINLRSVNSIPVIFDSTNSNIAIGAGVNISGGLNVVALGSSAGYNVSYSSFLVAIGCNAAYTNSGASVVSIGCNAGSNNQGASNIFIGSNAGSSNIGSNVVAIGANAAQLNSNSNVIAIGLNAGNGNSNSNTIFLGNGGGYSGPTAGDSLIVYSTGNNSVPFLFGDLSGNRLGIGKQPTATLDVNGSGAFSGNLTAISGYFTSITVSGIASFSSVTISGTLTVSGLATLSAATIQNTLSATNLYAPTGTISSLTVTTIANISYANVQNTLSTAYLYAPNAVITTLSLTSLSVSSAFAAPGIISSSSVTTISYANVQNTLSAGYIFSSNAIITTISATTLNVSGLTTLTTLSVQSTLSSTYIFSPNAVITTLSLTSLSVSSAFVAPGITSSNSLTTISYANVQNTLSAGYIFSSNAIITTLSTATLNVSGLTTLTTLSVQSTLSSAYIFSPNATITTLSTTTLNVSGTLTVKGTTVFPNLSGLMTLNGIPVLLDQTKPFICLGINASLGGSDVITLGISAGLQNSGAHVYAIGCNAVTNNSGEHVYAFGFQTGSSNTGSNLVAFGSNTAWSNTGNTIIAIGDGACTTNSGSFVIAVGSNAGRSNAGGNTIAIGTNAGNNNNASLGIFIGSNAGSNTRFSNALVLGNNPSGGYSISAANTFLVYSTVSSRPFLQGDMSAGFFGIGKNPSAALDVIGSGIFSCNLTVSLGTTTLSYAVITTLSATNGVITTLSSTSVTTSAATVRGTLSASNIYVGGTGGLGITIANTGIFTMNGTFSNGAGSETKLDGATLGATTINGMLNGVTWPGASGTTGQILKITSANTAGWADPAAVSLAGWAQNRAVQDVDMSSNGLINLASINNVPISFGTPTTRDFIGLGYGTLSGATGDEIFAIGRNAGLKAGGSNLIYLGSNPGGDSPLQSNFFNMYSTTSGIPFLQGDLSAMWLGIGKTPSAALDVSGSATIRGSAFNVCAGLATLSSVQVVNTLNVSGQATFTSNVSFTSLSASNVFVYTGGILNVSGSTSLAGLQAASISGSSLYSSGGLKVETATTLLGSTTVSNTLSVTGLTTLSNLTAATISGTSLYSSGGLKVDLTTTLVGSTTVSNTLNVIGLTTLGTLSATTISGLNIFVSNSLNVSGLVTVSGLTVQRNLSVGGSTTLSGTTINGLLTVCGQTAFTNLCFAQLNGISWVNPTADKTILSWNSTGNTIKWDTISFLGLGDWAKSKAVSTISADNNGITGIVSFNNISAIFSASPFQIGIGPNALRANAQENIIALGISAGAIGGSTTGAGPNCIFLGSNPGGSSNLSNSLVVYSQTAGSPLIYGDLSRNQVTINATTATEGLTSTAGYTLNVNGSARATTLTITGSSTFTGITVTSISNSGISTLNGTVNIPGTNTLSVSGQATFSNVNILTALSAQTAYISNGFGVGGATTLAGATLTGAATLQSSITVAGSATFNGISVPGSVDYHSEFIRISTGATTRTVIYRLAQNDTRNINDTPSQMRFRGPGIIVDFKDGSVIANGGILPNGYTMVVTYIKWPDTSGGPMCQIAYTNDLRTFIRWSSGSGEAELWLPWKIYGIGGDDTQVLFNSNGSITGSSSLTFNTATSTLTVSTLRGNTATISQAIIPVSLNVSGSTTLSGVTLNVLNGVSWPATKGNANQQLAMNDAGSAAVWADPGKADARLWSCNKAVETVNMSGYGLSNLTSINGLSAVISSTTDQIGIGNNVFAANTGSKSIAFGSNAGSNSGATAYTNCIYLGNNPGTSVAGANTFLVYSTNANIPFLQGDMTNNYLGIGVVPSYALDVKGTAHVSTNLLLNGNMAIGSTLPAASTYPINIKGTGATTGTIAFYNSVVTTIVPYVGVGYDEPNDGLALRTNYAANDLNTTALFIKRSTAIPYVGVQTTNPQYPLDVNGQINTNASFSSPTTSSNSIGGITLNNGSIITTGTARLGNTVAGTISGTNLTATGSLTVSGLTTLSAAVVQYALNVSGLTSLSNLQAATISGSSLYSSGSITAAQTVAATTLSGSTVNAGIITSTGNTTVQGTLSAAISFVTGTTTLLGSVGIGGAFNTSYPLTVSGTINCTSNIISTLNVAGIPSGSALTLLATNATTYYSLTTQAQTITITFPTTTPTQGTYWVVKNNSTVNYTLTSINGVFNGGNTTTYYLQSGIGITLAYSGTQGTNGSNAYYTF